MRRISLRRVVWSGGLFTLLSCFEAGEEERKEDRESRSKFSPSDSRERHPVKLRQKMSAVSRTLSKKNLVNIRPGLSWMI